MRVLIALALTAAASGVSACDFDGPWGSHMNYLRQEDAINGTDVASQAWDNDASMQQARAAFTDKFAIDTSQDAQASTASDAPSEPNR